MHPVYLIEYNCSEIINARPFKRFILSKETAMTQINRNADGKKCALERN